MGCSCYKLYRLIWDVPHKGVEEIEAQSLNSFATSLDYELPTKCPSWHGMNEMYSITYWQKLLLMLCCSVVFYTIRSNLLCHEIINVTETVNHSLSDKLVLLAAGDSFMNKTLVRTCLAKTSHDEWEPLDLAASFCKKSIHTYIETVISLANE